MYIHVCTCAALRRIRELCVDGHRRKPSRHADSGAMGELATQPAYSTEHIEMLQMPSALEAAGAAPVFFQGFPHSTGKGPQNTTGKCGGGGAGGG